MAILHSCRGSKGTLIEGLEPRIVLTGGVNFPLYDLPDESGTRFDGEVDSNSGTFVAILGDINADGFDDFAIAAPFYHSFDGRIHVVFGNGGPPPEEVQLSSLDGSNGFVIDAVSKYDELRTVNDAGDVNGDGIDDFLVGAFQHSFSGPSRGAVYVIFGQTGSFGASFDLASLDGTNGFRIDGASDFAHTHFANSAGDVNGDGFGDVIIGSPNLGVEEAPQEEAAYVVFGAPTGVSASIDLNDLNGANGFRINGLGGHEYFGVSVSGAGDVNADGFDDVLIGAQLASPHGTYSGSSFVIFGKTTFSAEIDSASLDGTDGFRINGSTTEARAGYVSNAGDVNADGIADIMIGTTGDTVSTAGTSGSAYIIYGKTGGFDPLLELATVDGVNGSRIGGSGFYFVSGGLVRGVGDVSGDGIDDVMIGAWSSNGSGDSAHVLFGRAGGFGSYFSVEHLNGTNGFHFSGTGNGGVASGDGGGDINGDGIPDIVLGDPNAQKTGRSSGSTYVIYHAPDNAPPVIFPTNSATILPGTSTEPIAFQTYDPEIPADALIISAVSSNPALISNESLVIAGTGSDRTITATAVPDLTGIAVITLQVSDGELTTEQQFQVNVFGPDAVLDFADLAGTDGYRINGEYAGDRAGAVSGAGDLNGDGFDDFIVGVERAHPHGEYSGAAFVVFGQPGGGLPIQELSQLDGSNGFQINGAAARHGLGISVSGIGDFNGDGFDDLIVGALGANNGDDRQGRAYIVFGKSQFAAELEVSSLDGRNGFALAGEQGSRSLGKEVAGAGDVNGDGFADVFITSKRAGYVLFGRAGTWAPERSLATLDGANGFRVETTPDPGDRNTFVGMNTVGDVNGDGFADFGVQGSHSRHIVFGRADGFPATLVADDVTAPDGFKIDLLGIPKAAGDFNGDGIDDFVMSGGGDVFTGGTTAVIYGQSAWGAVVDFSKLDGTHGFLVKTGYSVGRPAPNVEQEEDILEVSSAGDVNRDGFDDLLLSIPSTFAGNDIFDRVSTVYLVFGSADGPGATLALANLDGTNGVRWNGISSAGPSISDAGDLNDDGYDDFVVGAYGLDGHGPYTGGAFVVYGSGDPFLIEPTISASGHKATFTDVDGDVVTVKTSVGRFQASDFTLSHPAQTLPDGGIFQRLSLGSGFDGANLTISATPGPNGGDGRVNLGFLDAAGVDLGKVTIAGDLGRIEAGDANQATSGLHRLKVQSLGALGLSNQPADDASLDSFVVGDVGTIRADDLTDGFVLKGGIKVAEGIHDSALHIAGALSRIEVGVGMTNSSLTLRGHLQPGDSLDARALGSADFGSSLILSRILVGYDSDGLPVNADVQTGRTKVRGDWTASDLIVGAMAGFDGKFGTDDDALIPGGGSIVARVAKIVVKGRITGTMDTSDSFGIVAEEIVAAKLESRSQSLSSGARNDLQGIRFGTDLDFLLHEVTG